MGACVPSVHAQAIKAIYTTLPLKIKGNHRCIYPIYPVVMATGYILVISRRHGSGGLVCPIVVAICLGTFQQELIIVERRVSNAP